MKPRKFEELTLKEYVRYLDKAEYLVSRGYVPRCNVLKLAKELFLKEQEKLNKK